MWFIGVEVEQETSAPPPKKNSGSAPVFFLPLCDTEKKLYRGQNFLLNAHDKFADQAEVTTHLIWHNVLLFLIVM